ncbi:MAG: hypothetical protein EZS28_048723, partial [Streblomastix strix]
MQILNRLSPEEQQRVKRGFRPQMRLTSFYESQIQRKITEQNNNAIHIDIGWDFGSGTGEQQEQFQEDHVDESQYLKIRHWAKQQETQVQKTLEELDKAKKQLSMNTMVQQQFGAGQSPWTIVQLDGLSGTAREG